jgi:hypothetical protein
MRKSPLGLVVLIGLILLGVSGAQAELHEAGAAPCPPPCSIR